MYAYVCAVMCMYVCVGGCNEGRGGRRSGVVVVGCRCLYPSSSACSPASVSPLQIARADVCVRVYV